MEKMLVLKMRKDNAKRAAPIGAARLPFFFCVFCDFRVNQITVSVRQPPELYQRHLS